MTDRENIPAVVVCQSHLERQWVAEIQRFTPNLLVHRIRKGTPYELIKRRRQGDLWKERFPDVLVVSYHKLRKWADHLAPLVRYVIFDECQQLRRPDSDIYKACAQVRFHARTCIGLSATPIYNYGVEFFYVYDILHRGALGTYQEFQREWCTGDRIASPGDFRSFLDREGLLLRRTRKDVGRELPPLQKIQHQIDCDPKAIESITSDALNLARIIVKHNEQFRGEKMQASGELDNIMRQATGIAKAPYVAEFVRLLLENGDKVVLFAWHRAVYDILLERLREYSPAMYTGSESSAAKELAKQRFVKGETPLFIMSLRSGAGVDGLQGVSQTVVFGELDWSPGVHEQCVGRVYRDGQKDPCVAYFLVAEHGSDPVVAEVLGIKREQIEGVRNPDQDLIEKLDTGEDRIRRLARDLLTRRGEQIPEAPVVTSLAPLE